jgi:DNA-binding transcriptional ArsR family regulator
MVKQNFLLVDLNEAKTKKLAETITSDTSRKILNYLTEKDDSEANISKELGVAISTVHYHLQKLLEAGLVIVEEFHYSKKGREVNHYKLANKYIIIAPRNVVGLRQKLRGILPVAIAALGIGVVIKFIGSMGSSYSSGMIAEKSVESAVLMQDSVAESAPMVAEISAHVPEVVAEPNIALWFLVGAFTALGLYVLYVLIRNWKRKN